MIAAALLAPLFFAPGGAGPRSASAQGPCGTVDSLSYPMDPATYRVIYQYGVPSTRYDGRYHAGEDWFGGRASTYGTPVRAIAKGRVTYSAPFGWGLDKGVVIIEHLLPDGTWWYSMYGHMEEIDDYTFPAVFTCVNEGDIIGAVGRPRPAPHLHLEIRNFGADSPGPGYWGTDPAYSGWRNPSKFIQNWQAWLNPAHAWHADIADDTGPLYPAIIRADNVTIVFDDMRLKALNPSGQVLWRYIIPESLDVVGVMPYEESILVAAADGTLQRWHLEGGFIDQWQVSSTANTTAFTWQNLLIVHNGAANELIAYGPDRGERWRVPDVTRPVQLAQTGQMLGVASLRGALTLIGPDGRVIDRATLASNAALAPAPEGGFYVHSRTALWRVDSGGGWQRLADSPDRTPGGSTLASLPDGRFFLYAGRAMGRELYAYAPDGSPLWTAEFTGPGGQAVLLALGERLLLADGRGAITLLEGRTGETCAALTVWGNRAANAWAGVGPDGILRVHIADQVIGLNVSALLAGCPG